MKKFPFLIAMFLPLICFCQNPDYAVAKVFYHFKYMQDSAFKEKFREEDFILYLGKTHTHYLSFAKLVQDSILKKEFETQMRDNIGNVVMGNQKKRTTPIEHFFNIQEAKLYVQDKILKKYLYNDSVPKIDWQISIEKRKFDKYHCTKAIGKFRGRTYIAWFTEEVPIPGGPWKLNGLPGLILEAYDLQKQVLFLFNGIENINTQSIITQPNTSELLLVKKKDFIELQKAIAADPVGYINANSDWKISSDLKPKNPLRKVPNPIEITEN